METFWLGTDHYLFSMGGGDRGGGNWAILSQKYRIAKTAGKKKWGKVSHGGKKSNKCFLLLIFWFLMFKKIIAQVVAGSKKSWTT